jgi:hypothetical protein
MVHHFAAVALILFLLFPGAPLPAVDLKAKTTSGASSDYRFSNRLSVELARARLVAIDVREAPPEDLPGSPVYQTIGLTSPLFVVGPVEQQGLHRVVGNPLGYRATSSALTEATRLRLDGSFSPASREAVSVRLQQERLQLSGIRTTAGYASGSLYGRPVDRPRLRSELFVVATETDPNGLAGSEGDSWYTEKRPRPGGPVTFTTMTIEVAQGHSGFKAFVGGSLSQALPPGAYSLLRYAYAGESLEVAAIAGRQSGYYAEPDGDYATSRDRLGGVLVLRRGTAELEVGHHFRREHPAVDGSSLGAREQDTILETELLLFDAAHGVVPVRGPDARGGLRVEAAGRWEGSVTRDGDAGGHSTLERRQELGVGATTTLSGAAELALGADYSYRYLGPPRRRLSLEGRLTGNRGRLLGRVEWAAEDGPLIPTADLELRWKWERRELRVKGSHAWAESGRGGESLLEVWLLQQIGL